MIGVGNLELSWTSLLKLLPTARSVERRPWQLHDAPIRSTCRFLVDYAGHSIFARASILRESWECIQNSLQGNDIRFMVGDILKEVTEKIFK